MTVFLVDSTLWIGLMRRGSPDTLKDLIAPHVTSPDASLADPIVFELLRFTSPAEAARVRQQIETVPVLPTPPDLWEAATALGQRCRAAGFNCGPIDLLVATIAIHHAATVVTFDTDFERIRAVAPELRVDLLTRTA